MGSSSRGRRLFLILLVGVLLALGLSGAPFALAGHATANQPGSNFEIDLNANLKVDDPAPSIDWASVTETRKSDEPTGKNDNSYAGGAKEDDTCPGTTTGSIPNNKSDLLTFGVYKESGSQAYPAGFLHVFWTRVQEPSGTTLMDFEFNKSGVDCGNGVNRVRTVGDLLIEYRIEQGGATAQVLARKWQGASWGPEQDLTAIGMATGTINSTPIPAGEADGLGALSARTFGEATIDLRFIFTEGVCDSFGSVFLKSRSSTSFTSQLKDYIAPQPITISNCGQVKIRKVTNPTGLTNSFGFTTTGGLTPSTFSLQHGGLRNYTDVLAGSYTVTENDPTPGFDLTSIDCSASTGATPTVNLATRTVSFTLAADAVVDCTYTNRARGTIIVRKQTVPAGAAGSFSFTGDAAGTIGHGQQITVANLVPGTYTSTEGDPTPGFDLTGISCDDSNSSGNTTTRTATFSLEAGETVTCTFTNTKRGTINIRKETDPDGAPGSFAFTASAGLSPTTFNLSDNGQRQFANVVPGQYTVNESDPAPAFTLDTLVCNDANSTGNTTTRTATINLEPGESVTCTFTNKRNTGAILIKKTAKNYTAGGSAPLAGVSFAVSLGGSQVATGTTNAAGELCVAGLTNGATYSVTETAAPTGYALDTNNPQSVTVNNFSTCASGNKDTVTFDNDPLSKITITFNSLAGPGVTVATSVQCTGPSAAGTELGPLGNGQSASITDLLEGTYICTIVVDP